MSIEKISDKAYTVSCPQQMVTSAPTRKRHKAVFDLAVCKRCPLQSTCPTIKRKKDRVLYFTHEYFLALKRQKGINSLPEERRKLRSNVEATMQEFVSTMPHRKLKVRGAFKASIFAFSVALGVNFGRIYHLIQIDPSSVKAISLYCAQIVKEQGRTMRRVIGFCYKRARIPGLRFDFRRYAINFLI
jgi:hypothetical protein